MYGNYANPSTICPMEVQVPFVPNMRRMSTLLLGRPGIDSNDFWRAEEEVKSIEHMK